MMPQLTRSFCLQPQLRAKLGVPVTDEQKQIQFMRLRYWATRFPPLRAPSGWPQPFTVLRARLRYWLHPADELQPSVVFYLLIVLNLSAYLQLCNWAMFLRFALIDKNDEHQVRAGCARSKRWTRCAPMAIRSSRSSMIKMGAIWGDLNLV